MDKPPIIFLMGPTGAGKTDAAIAFAEKHGAEIVSVDSAMIYRGMDIGTAKPEPQLRARIPHHLIDIRDPHQTYSVGQFLRDARDAVDRIHARGKIAVLTGGTMMYFHAALEGLADLPEADPDLRARIAERAAREGWASLHAELARIDPAAAGRIHPNDPQRIQRALEVCWKSGEPLSELQRKKRPLFDAARVVQVVMCPADRAELHRRIECRFDQMMARGFLEEVERLRAGGKVRREMPSMRAVGYRQLWGYLEGEYGIEQARLKAVAVTRQLAKRQLTWLRALPQAQWVEPGSELPMARRMDKS